MSLQQSYIALDWVKDALDETLQEALAQLQEQTPIAMQAAYESLHKVSGTLHIAQLADILMLSEVLEKVVQAVAVGRLHYSSVQTEVRQVIGVLIEELEHLQRTKSSRTTLVYDQVDLLNALLLNEAVEPKVSFVPDYSLVDEKFAAPVQMNQQEKLIQAYRFFLAAWLNDQGSEQALLDMTRVADLLHAGAQTRQEFALWQVARVFQRSVAKGYLTDIETIRPLLIRLERSLGADADLDSQNALLGDLLRALDPHQVADPEVSKVRQLYGMDLPEGVNVSTRLLDSALQQVNAARNGVALNRDTAAIALREAVRLLDVSGWHPLAKEGQAKLQHLITDYRDDDEVIEKLNADLTQFADKVKQTIVLTSKSDQLADGGLVQDARHAAVRESRTALEKIKAALAKYHQSRGDVTTLAAVPDLLQMVSGAFTMIELPRAAKLLSNTTAAMKSTILKAKYVPHWKQTDLLAQLISSIEYYLDQLAGQYQDDNILTLAERTLVEFKKPQHESQPVPAGGEKLYHDETTATVIDHIDELAVVASIEPQVSAKTEVVANMAAAELDGNDNPYNDDFEQDDEIREIFIEEAEEVLETIGEYFPKWVADFDDEASLKEMRRAFHTLKGSGRMVGARTVGELSWSIESLLNRVLDRSVQPNKSMSALIDTVYAAIPSLIESYKEKRSNPAAMNQQIAKWVTDANALMHARVVEVAEPTVQEEPENLAEEVAAISPEVSATHDEPKKSQPVKATHALPLHLLSEQAPKVVPEDDFVTYFGEDDPILEIFLEEAEEVIQELNENFPQWAVNFENLDALKVIRRNFHTLKGSGRMVGAHALAELAWSNERLLNGVLENTVAANQNMVQLFGDVISILPTLVEDFSKQRTPQVNLLPIIHTAWLLHGGHEISATQIQSVVQNAISGNADSEQLDHDSSEFPVLEEEQFLLEDFDALAEAFNAESEVEPQAAVSTPVAEPVASKNEMSIEELDPVLLEIFVSEAEGYLENIRTFIGQNIGQSHVMTNDVLLRALHTLRGSAGMTGIESIYQLANVMEHECKRLMREHVAMNDEHLDALAELDRLATIQVNQLKSNQMPALDADSHAFIHRVGALAPKKKDAESHAPEPVFTGLVTELMDIGIDDVLDAEWTLEEQLSGSNALEHVATLHTQMSKLSEAVVHVPIAPLVALTVALQETYQHMLNYPALLAEDIGSLQDDLLAGHMALTRMFDELAASLQVQPVNALISSLQYWQTQKPAQDAQKEAALPEVVTPTQKPEAVASETVSSAAVEAVHLEYPVDAENDAELLEVFMEEAEELVQDIDQSFTAWTADTSKNEPLKALQRHLHTLKGGARMARVESLGDYTHELETVYERLVENCQNTPEVLVRFLRHAQDQVAQQVEKLAQSQKSFYTPTETSILNQFIKSRDIQVLQGYFDLIDNKRTGASAAVAVAAVEQPKVEPVAAPVVAAEPVVAKQTAIPDVEPVEDIPKLGQMQVLAEAWDEGSAPDADVLEIFLDEAGEIVDSTSVQLSKWLKGSNEPNDPAAKKLLQDLQRNLHTFKGGARMAGVDSLGDLSHEMEFVYEDLALGKRPVTPEIGVLLNQSHDWLADAIAVLDRGERPQMPQPLIDALRLFRKDPALLAAASPAKPSAETPVVKAPAQPTVSVVKATEKPAVQTVTAVADESGLPPMAGMFVTSHDSDVSSSEMVRVSATMMEKMINLAGENAISRARIEMELTGFAVTVGEMGTAIQKISEQLRRMDGELESQIIARHHDEVSQQNDGGHQDFDPLEMDQYSSINQLSKSLAESVSDLLDFKNTLVEKARDSESLLLQQSRIQSELQEGLMSSRLVPFSRLVPRLQRVVRQTATELGKPVELTILNAEGELDRSVLERMVAPLEHMLRNAVDHGMESPVDRGLQRKSEKGSITLSVLREGSEVIITLQDDGRGINVDAVRRKAIERGIIEAAAELTDIEVMQLIFHAGLSTASQVTQISGRGVGMDVVQSEIRQLGGVVSVSSVAGQGTCFTLRLPLTVAVTDALRVRIGDRIFAVSLSQIERIVRVSNTELENFYQSNKETYAIDGQQYRLRYLGELIGGSHTPILYGQNIPSPLLLVKYEGQRFAIQVDQLIGSREEMVIKPVGVQLVTVGSISGATILGDGSVVIILDLVALARSAGSVARMRAVSQAELKASSVVAVHKQTIMVVDDSVTVRKVTTRLLERNGYLVITAKDGVDAMSKLEDAHPDLMLLDIEMPRMDGFEVATLVRHNPRLAYLPIIMITSRTGEKHRERAYSVGVDAYMGKPFQEQMLLENISDLIEAKAAFARNTTA